VLPLPFRTRPDVAGCCHRSRASGCGRPAEPTPHIGRVLDRRARARRVRRRLGWSGVIVKLQSAGVPVLAPPNSLRGLDEGAYIAERVTQIDGPVLLVGHS
jgi:hypothetical protein